MTMNDWVLPWSGRSINYTIEDRQTVVDAMYADPQTQGRYQKEFEENFKAYHRRKHAFAVNSCASALELAAMLCEIKFGQDEVIIPAHTYCATAIPFARRGAIIKWADIDPNYLVMTANEIEPLITPHTKAVVVVHLYGLNTPMKDIMDLAKHHKLIVIEDCAQSLGATYEGRRSGWHGDIACYSFHGQKNITTLGEGGMITVKPAEWAWKVPGLRHNGHRCYPAQKSVGFDIDGVYPYNFSIGEAQCALGISLLNRLDEINARRRANAKHIIGGLSDIGDIRFQEIPVGSSHAYHLLVSRCYVPRDALMQAMHRQKVETVVQYIPLYRQPLFRPKGKFQPPPVTEAFFLQAMSFPFYEWFTETQLDYLLQAVRRGLKAV